MDYKTLSNEELLDILKKTPDFDKLVFPNDWYSKFQLPEKKCLNTKEFIAESPWLKRFQYTYEPKIYTIDAKPGGMRPILPAPEVPTITVIENSFSDTKDQNDALHLQVIDSHSEDSTKSNDSKNQPSKD